MYVSFHLNHIGVVISVNGEEVFESGRASDEIPEMICGSYWSGWLYEEAKPEDVIEIRLHNPHNYGNAGAYEEFLNSLHLGGGIALENHLKAQSTPYWIVGSVMLVAGTLAFCYYRVFSYKRFGGITGDLAGYFVQIFETAILVAVVFAQRIIEVLL